VPTEAQFLAHILAEPDNDGPRLVFCDQLEEWGEAARAEFIRLQIELARLPMPAGSPNHDVNRDPKCGCPWCQKALPLRYRSQDILDRHAHEWLSGWIGDRIMAWSKYGTCVLRSPRRLHGEHDWFATWERGFVSAVMLSWEDWAGGVSRFANSRVGMLPGHADAILRAAPVQEVRLTTMLDVPQLAKAAKLPIPFVRDVDESVIRSILSAAWPRIRKWVLPEPATQATGTNTAMGFVVPLTRETIMHDATAQHMADARTAGMARTPRIF